MYSAATNFQAHLSVRQSRPSHPGGSPPVMAPTCRQSPNFCCELLRRPRPVAAKRPPPCLVTTSIMVGGRRKNSMSEVPNNTTAKTVKSTRTKLPLSDQKVGYLY